MSLLRNVAGLALGLVLLGAVAVAQNDDTPLGDVARQPSGQKATHTFDDDNFQRSAPPPAPAPEAKAGNSAKTDAGAKDAKAGDKPADAPKEDVKALEKQLADLKQGRDTNSEQIARLQSKIDGGTLDDDMRKSLADAQEAYKARLAGINDQIPVLEKKLEAARAAQKSDSGEAAAGDDSSQPAESKPADGAKSK